MNIIKIADYPEFQSEAAIWFSHKWNIPITAYFESMAECIAGKGTIPQWYIVLNENNHIIAGAGVIENDFHNRKDLSPNLCALFVEEIHRNRGIAKEILNFTKKDLGKMGCRKVYLVTDHTAFYEKYGWQFLTMVKGDDGLKERLYVTETL